MLKHFGLNLKGRVKLAKTLFMKNLTYIFFAFSKHKF